MTTVAITGATGNVGREVVRLLLAKGVSVRALGRDAGKLAALASAGADARSVDLHDAKSLAPAFRGVDAVFALVPPAYAHPDPRADQRQIADATAAAVQVSRVKHAVTLSSIGADQAEGTGPIVGLRGMEERFNAVPGLAVVHLRPGYFFENSLAGIPLIKAMGVNGGLVGPDVEMVMTASRDVAAAAAALLGNPSFSGQQVRELHGPRPYTMAGCTRILGEAIGRPDLKYLTLTAQDIRKAMAGSGFSDGMLSQYIEMLTAFNEGRVRPLQKRSAATTSPTTFEEFSRSVFATAFNQ